MAVRRKIIPWRGRVDARVLRQSMAVMFVKIQGEESVWSSLSQKRVVGN